MTDEGLTSSPVSAGDGVLEPSPLEELLLQHRDDRGGGANGRWA